MALARATIIYGLGTAASAAANLALLPVLSRELGPQGYGSLGVFFSLVGLLAAIIGLNLHGLVVRRACADDGTLRGVVGACLYLLLTSLGLCVLALAAGGDRISAWTGISATWLWLALGASACQFLVNLVLALWQAEERPAAYALLAAAIAILGAAASLWLVLFQGAGSAGRVLGMLLAVGLGASFSLSILLRRGLVEPRPSATALREALRYGVPLVPHALGSWAFLAADRSLVAGLAGLEQAGLYFAAAQLAQVVTLANDAVNKAWVPWFFRRLADGEDGRLDICRKGRRLALAYLGLALLVGALAPLVAGPLLGPGYAGTGLLIALLALGYAIDGIYKLFINVLFHRERTDLILWVTLSGGATALGVDILLIPVLGAAGAAVGLIAGTTVSALLAYVFAQHLTPLPWLRRG